MTDENEEYEETRLEMRNVTVVYDGDVTIPEDVVDQYSHEFSPEEIVKREVGRVHNEEFDLLGTVNVGVVTVREDSFNDEIRATVVVRQ